MHSKLVLMSPYKYQKIEITRPRGVATKILSTAEHKAIIEERQASILAYRLFHYS